MFDENQQNRAMINHADRVDHNDLANTLRAALLDTARHQARAYPAQVLGLADVAVALWSGHFQHNPGNPDWSNRDRLFVAITDGDLLIEVLETLSGYQNKQNRRQCKQPDSTRQIRAAVAAARDSQVSSDRGLSNAPGNLSSHVYLLIDGQTLNDPTNRQLLISATDLTARLIVLVAGDPAAVSQPLWSTSFATLGDHWNVPDPVVAANRVAIGQTIAMARKLATQPTLIRCLISPSPAAVTTAIGAPADWPYRANQSVTVHPAWDARELGRRRESQWARQCEHRRDNPQTWVRAA